MSTLHSSSPDIQAFRGNIVDWVGDPDDFPKNDNEINRAIRNIPDGIVVTQDGKITHLGDAHTIIPNLPNTATVHDYRGQFIMPGFVDTHIHYAQCDVIASFGAQLLAWLNQYTFPTERRFADKTFARATADFFLQELYRNGTTTAMVFATVHKASVQAFIESCEANGAPRMVVGKVLMDRNAPEYLRDTAQSGYDDSKELIEAYHGKACDGRLLYALTPRFAPTSTEAQLESVQALIAEHPTVHLQTHLAENLDEVRWVEGLFPWSRSYLDVYDCYGMLRPRSVFAHCVHLNSEDRDRLQASGAAISFCPTSNLFLCIGLFDMKTAFHQKIRLGLATDVGGGTSFSMLRTLSEAYKVGQLAGYKLTPAKAFYLATLGSAKAIYLDEHIGNLSIGKEANLVVMNTQNIPLLHRRMEVAEHLEEKLFALMMIGDDRVVEATYINGKRVYQRQKT